MATNTGKSNTTLILWLVLIFSFFCFIGAPILFLSNYDQNRPRQAVSIQGTISRANRIIAIDASDQPSYRWVFYTSSNSTRVGEKGTIYVHQPASLSYGTGWIQRDLDEFDSVYISLTPEEWENVEQWRTSWCREAPIFRSIAEDQPFYIVALRCQWHKATTFRLLKEELPVEIEGLLRRATMSTDESPRETIETVKSNE